MVLYDGVVIQMHHRLMQDLWDHRDACLVILNRISGDMGVADGHLVRRP